MNSRKVTVAIILGLLYTQAPAIAEDAITAPAQKTIGGQAKIIPSLAPCY